MPTNNPAPKKKPRTPTKARPNLQSLIRNRALHSKAPTDIDIQALLIAQLYDLPDDQDHHAGRSRVKLDILKALHEINQDNKETKPLVDSLEADVLALLARRRK